MISLGFDQKSPQIYQMVAELEQDYTDIGFDVFLESIQSKLGEKVAFLSRTPRTASTRSSTSSTRTRPTPFRSTT